MTAILRLFGDAKVAYVGPAGECYRRAALVTKWDGARVKVHELFDDGLTYENHCASLYIQHDGPAWRDMEELFTNTKKQGKTAKTVWKKEDYFKRGFSKIITKHGQRLFAYENQENRNKPYDEQFRYDSSLVIWWMNYYFANYDTELNYKPSPLYPLFDEYSIVVKNAVIMDRRMKGNRTEPKLDLFKCSEASLGVESRNSCCLCFEWDDMDFSEACMLMDTFEEWHYRCNDGKNADWSKPLNKKIRKMFPKCEVKFMDVKHNLYGDQNNWFNVYFTWKSENFSWGQVRKAQRAVKNLIVPLIKHPFKPAEAKA